MTIGQTSTDHLSKKLARASAALPTRARAAGSHASRLMAPLLLAVMPCALGCVTPLVIGDGRLGFGLFNVCTEDITPDVRYSRVSGIGLLFTESRISLGLSHDLRLTARLNDDEEGYSVETPMAHIAVGRVADRMAASREPLLVHPY
jgi:hypothetical protein